MHIPTAALLCGAAALLAGLACDTGKAASGGSAGPWSPPANGLRIALDLPSGPHRAGTHVTVGLRFQNLTKTQARVFLLAPEAFRANQSTFLVVQYHPRREPVCLQPPPRPHGYLPRETDFPAIAMGKTLSATQTLSLSAPAFRHGGQFHLEWTYENTITRMPGGARTLDGVTRSLFGGGPIPGLWTGSIMVQATFLVRAP